MNWQARPYDRCRRKCGVFRRAYSLIEVLLVVLLIGILIALWTPSLSRFRQQGRQTKSLANLQQHASTPLAYAGDYTEIFPYLTDPLATTSVIRCPSAEVAVTTGYFGVSNFWWVGLADGYYQGNLGSPAFHSPLGVPTSPGSDYIFACSLVADPEFYDLTTRRVLPAQLRPIRVSEVTFPAQKVLIADGTQTRDESKVFLPGFGDAHAGVYSPDRDLLEQMVDGDGSSSSTGGYSGHWPWWIPGTHTLRGVRGMDIR